MEHTYVFEIKCYMKKMLVSENGVCYNMIFID